MTDTRLSPSDELRDAYRQLDDALERIAMVIPDRAEGERATMKSLNIAYQKIERYVGPSETAPAEPSQPADDPPEPPTDPEPAPKPQQKRKKRSDAGKPKTDIDPEQVLLLYERKGQTYKKLAAFFECSESTIRNLLRTARDNRKKRATEVAAVSKPDVVPPKAQRAVQLSLEPTPAPTVLTVEEANSERAFALLGDLMERVLDKQGLWEGTHEWRDIPGEQFAVQSVGSSFIKRRKTSIAPQLRDFFSVSGVPDFDGPRAKKTNKHGVENSQVKEQICLRFRDRQGFSNITWRRRMGEGHEATIESILMWPVDFCRSVNENHPQLASWYSKSREERLKILQAGDVPVRLPVFASFTKLGPTDGGVPIFEMQIIDQNIRQYAAALFLAVNWNAYTEERRRFVEQRYGVTLSSLRLMDAMYLGVQGIERDYKEPLG